jgi:hypothetical protein
MITELNKYTFAEFTALPADERDLYKAFGLHLKVKDPTDKPVLEWEWAKVKQIQTIINQPSLSYADLAEIVALASDKPQEDIAQMLWYEVFPIYNFLVKEIAVVNKQEQALAYEPDAKELSAGADNYAQFGWFATLNRLAGGDPLKYDAIGQQPYSVIFSTLLLQKTDREYEKALIRLNTPSHV